MCDGMALHAQRAAVAHHIGFTLGVFVESAHGKGGNFTAREFEEDNLVIDDIVVTREDAATIGTFGESFSDGFHGGSGGDNVNGPAVEMVAEVFQVNLLRGVSAF